MLLWTIQVALLLYSAYDELFVITFLVSNATATSDFTYGKYFLRNKRVEGAYCSKKIACSKKILPEKCCILR